MTLIDDGAAKERLREIAATSKASLDARMRQVAVLNEQARAAVEREEGELKAALQRRAEVQAAAAAPAPREARPKRTLSLGAPEFAEQRAARQAPPPVQKQPEPDRPRRTLRLGADDDPGAESTKKRERPVRPRPAAGDDDMSGRTWLR